ncbi:MAG TPA: ABC transporter substrate-binding protein [Anaerolineae bacterium]|nr:ABC transporter substrate-binding protein [Anaerolineae bacterium]
MSRNKQSQNRLRNPWTILVSVIVVALLLSGCSNPTPKVYRVGILSGLDFFAPTADGFKAKMTELGYVEGKNIVYDIQKTNFDPTGEGQILQKFVADQVDLILVFPTEVSLAAKTATQGTNIPVLFANANIEGIDLVDSVREPGGNITGVRFPGPDLAIKRFEILHELAPDATRMWIPYQRGYPNVAPQLEAVRPVAEAAGVTLVEAPADNLAELEAELQTRAQAADLGLDAILFIAEPLSVTPEVLAVTVEFATEHNLPIGGAFGSVFGVSTDNVAVGRQAAPLADKIFKGAAAGTIPVASAENFLQINYKMAQALGLTVPEGLLSQAAEIIR